MGINSTATASGQLEGIRSGISGGLATHKEDVPPAELQKRVQAMCAGKAQV